MKKWIAMLLLACLIVGVCPISAFGEEIAQVVETQAPAAETAKAEAPKAEAPGTETPKTGEAKTEAAKEETEGGKTVIVGTIEEPEKSTEATEPGAETETTASTEETKAPAEKAQDSTEATEETTEPAEETTEPAEPTEETTEPTEPTDETTEETEETTEPTEETVPEEEEEKNYRVYITTNLSALGGVIRKGDVVVLTAHLEGFEDEQYTIEWQCSPDNSNWRSASGVAGVSASGETCRVVVSAENAHYYWRVLVTIQ